MPPELTQDRREGPRRVTRSQSSSSILAALQLAAVLTPDELSHELGVSKRTIQRWRRLRKDPLPATRPPGARRVLFVFADVLDWLRRHQERPSLATPRAVRRRPTS